MSNNISSIHFKKSTRFQVYHNDKIRPNYAIGGEILCNKSSEEAVKLRDEIIEKAKSNYQKNNKSRNKNFQTTNYLWSAVVNIRDDVKTDDAMKQLEELADYFHKTHKFQCFQISIHRDEGHINENGEKIINHHAHLEFVTLDKENGKQVFKMRDFDKDKLREIQTKTAEILGMERGKPGAKRIEPRKWAILKEQEKATTKQLKADLEQEKAENKQLKADLVSQKAVNSAFEEIRQLMIADKISTADDYKELAKYKKEALQQAKSKELTKEQLDNQIAQIQQSYNEKIKAKDEKIEKLEKAKIDEYIKSNEMEKSNKELLDSYLASADTLEKARTQIEIISVARNFDDIALSQAKNTITKLKEELKNKAPNSENKADDVKEQILTLEKENNALKKEISELKKTIKKLSTLKDYIETYFHDVVNKYLSFMKNTNKLDDAIQIEPKAQQLTPKKDEPKAKNRGFSRC